MASWNSAISRRSDIHERLVALGGDAAAIDDRLAAARLQHQERILAEEGVARDALAALDALEQERVVGVFRDLEEGRDRRQEVGDDLLHDGHERAAPGKLDELFESGLLHRCVPFAMPVVAASAALPAAFAARSKRPTGGRCPVHSSN